MDACIIHLAKYPELQKEIYSDVIENETESNSNSFSASPLLLAFIFELLRVMPAVPIDLPRYIENDVWVECDDGNKYKIPKGSLIHQNIVGINYCGREYENPEKFDIYRWVKKDKDTDKLVFNRSQNNNELASFSYGKRDCVGKNLAKKVLQVVMTELIKNYEFSFGDNVDPDGVEIKFGMDLTYHMNPEIAVKISPRQTV